MTLGRCFGNGIHYVVLTQEIRAHTALIVFKSITPEILASNTSISCLSMSASTGATLFFYTRMSQ